MRLRFLAVAFAACAVPAAAGAQAFFHAVPPASAYRVTKDVVYAQGDSGAVKMNVYAPVQAGSGRPVMVFLNTRYGAPQRDHPIYVGWASLATARGMVAILPDAAPRFAAGLDALLAYLRAHAAELGIDADRVAVYAASGNVFGGWAALQDPARRQIQAAVVYYGGGDSVRFRRDLPVLFVRAGLDRPGLNASLDRLVGQGLRENAPVRVINLPGAHHAFEMVDDDASTRDAIDRTLDFVASALDPAIRVARAAAGPEAEAAGAVGRGDYDTAARLYAGLVGARPNDPRLRLSYAEALLGAGRYGEARAEFAKLRGAPLGPRDLGLPAARAAVLGGDGDEAIAWLRSIPRRFLPLDTRDDPAFAPLLGRADFRALFE